MPLAYDVIVIGAGHNGLAATALLAKRGLRVLCLEKNAYAGGMAGTREILSGCRNDVGASLLFPLAKGIAQELELVWDNPGGVWAKYSRLRQATWDLRQVWHSLVDNCLA